MRPASAFTRPAAACECRRADALGAQHMRDQRRRATTWPSDRCMAGRDLYDRRAAAPEVMQLLRRLPPLHPPLHILLQHIERQLPAAEDLVVEGADVELRAELALRVAADLADL